MAHKIELVKEFSISYGQYRLYVYIDESMCESFAEDKMGEAMNFIAEKEKLLREDKGKQVLHIVEIK